MEGKREKGEEVMNGKGTAKVSVIVPVYNAERYLKQCVESILAQTLKNVEIIFVDDGSTDGSLEILKDYQAKDYRVRVISQENTGGGAARNRGMKEASGEYLCFLDADDYFEPAMLERMSSKMDATGSDICVAKVRCWHEDLGFYTDEYAAMREEYLPEKDVFSWEDMKGTIFNTFHNWPWNKLFRRSFVERKGLAFQEIKRTNDLLFTCSALVLAERITTLKEVMVNYRVGITGNCQTTNTAAPLDFYQAFQALRKFLQEQGIYEEVEQSFLNHALDGCMANLNSQENSPAHETLFHQLRGSLMKELGITDQPADYFYPFNQLMYENYRLMMEKDYITFLRKRIQDMKDERDRCLIGDYKDKMYLADRVEEEKRRCKDTEDWWRKECDRVCKEIEKVYKDSFSYKAGHAVTSPLRACARLVKKTKL